MLRWMPTYEYECAKCKKSFEIVQSMKDDALKSCPKDKCRMKTWGKGKVKRKVGAGAGFIFKGSGFYITDYRSEGYKASKAKNDSSSSSSSSSDSSSSSKKEGNHKPDAPKSDAPKPAPAAKKDT
jgi:putative FmdB family regulatory protein